MRTNRTFTDIETKEVFALHMDQETHKHSLVSDGSEKFAAGTEVNGFYICAHSGCHVKVNSQKVIHLPIGTFYHLKEGERVTHRKFTGFTKYSRI